MIQRLKFIIISVMLFFAAEIINAQEATTLLQKVKAKIDLVNDYSAKGKMKTNVVFLKVPVAGVNIFFKKPNKLKIKNEKGISFVPKGAVNLNLNNILSGNKYSVIDAGKDKVGSTVVRVVKLLPEDDNADVVLSTLYIDETNLVVLRAKTTTRDNGSYELEMSYGKYISLALPDKIIFSFNAKDYKLPKGVTFDFDDGALKKPEEKMKNRKGKAEICISSYIINKGLADNLFL